MRNKYIFNITFIICVFNLITAYSDTIKISSEKLEMYTEIIIFQFFLEMFMRRMTQLNCGQTKYLSFMTQTEKSVNEIIAENNVKIIVNGVTAYGNFSKYRLIMKNFY